jgi:hypothetical protein
MTTRRELLSALDALDAVRQERLGIVNRMSALERSVIAAEAEATNLAADYTDAAGLRVLGEVPVDAVEDARKKSEEATQHVRSLSSAMKVLRGRLKEIEQRELAAQQHRNDVAAVLAAPLVASASQHIQCLAAEFSDALVLLAKLSGVAEGTVPTGDNFARLAGEPALILRRKRIRVLDNGIYTDLEDRDALTPAELLAMLPADEAAAQ